MQDSRDRIVQEILSEAIENIFPKDSNELIENFIETEEILTILEVERKLSETSGISSGFEDSFSKTASEEDIEMKTSAPGNETIRSCDKFLDVTIDEAIDRFEFEENFKEASVQTSTVKADKECQCDMIITTDEQFNKNLKKESTIYCKNVHWEAETNIKNNICFEGTEVCQRTFSSPKQMPRIRLGLSKRARLQPLYM